MQQRFLLQILLLAQHISGTTTPIIRSSSVLYSCCCLWYFVLWFSSCWSGVELRVMCPVCRMLQHPANRTHNLSSTPDHHSSSILSDDRSKASSETMPPYSAIQSLLLQMGISSPVLKVIQYLPTSSSSSSCHFHLALYLSLDNLF